MNYFEYATRNKLRFQYKGVILPEDLWDLPLTALDTIYKELNQRAKGSAEESLLQVQTKVDGDLIAGIEIIKHIVAVRQEEEQKRLKAKELREQKRRLTELIESKKDEALQGKSIEELTAMIRSLEE